MRVTLNYCTIADVQQVTPKKGDNQKKDRIVLLNIDEENVELCRQYPLTE